MTEMMHGEVNQPKYEDIDTLVGYIPGANGEACTQILADYRHLFEAAPGSSHNHQAWPGGYMDHVTEAMNIVSVLYDSFDKLRRLPFDKSDALLVVFLHDIEKPFRYTYDEEGTLIIDHATDSKSAKTSIREAVTHEYGIKFNPQQANAMKYIEGIRDEDYKSDERVMGELAALCHSADVLSARLWYNHPLAKGKDEWWGAGRVQPQSAGFILNSEIGD